MRTLRLLILTGAILPLAAVAATDSFAQGGQIPQMCRPAADGTPPVLSPADRVTCAENAVDRARRQLERLTQQNRDTAEAEQRLANAEAELTAAQEALAAAGDTQQGDDTAQTADDTQQQEEQQQEEATAPPNQNQQEPPADQGQQTSTPPTKQQQEGSVVDLQLQKQGDTKEIDRIRRLRDKIRQGEGGNGTASGGGNQQQQQQQQQGQSDGTAQPGKVVRQSGDRTIIQLGNQIVIRQGAEQETDRLLYGARDAQVDRLPNGYTRSVITREDGTKIVTTRDQFGQIVKRVRIDRRGREVVMIDDQGYNQGKGPRGPGQHNYRFDRDLPPVRVQIPRDQYVVETRRASRRQIEQALMAPPIEESERLYSLDEIRYSQRLRDKVRRIDVDTITFDFGSAAINPSQFNTLTALGEALSAYLANNPWATILVEGHTDAVGSDYANLLLSDRRAEALAVALTSYFDIPPENLVTQGYGEQFLKVDTQLPERLNRRATLRNVTGLVQDEQY